eukprot:4517839-Pyramimonas_sp.AAC.1
MALAGTVFFFGRAPWRRRWRWRATRASSTACCVGGDVVTIFRGNEVPVYLAWEPGDAKYYPGVWADTEDCQELDRRDH